MSVVIYHNPKCSKSRGALALLEERGADHDVVQYLDTPPTREDLERILDGLDEAPEELVRKDAHFKELGLAPEDYTDREAVIALLLEHPRLMQRPLVLGGGRTVIGRPPENVAQLLD